MCENINAFHLEMIAAQSVKVNVNANTRQTRTDRLRASYYTRNRADQITDTIKNLVQIILLTTETYRNMYSLSETAPLGAPYSLQFKDNDIQV